MINGKALTYKDRKPWLNKINFFLRSKKDTKINYVISCSALKKSYRSLALKHHPDRGGNAENFQLITKAYLSLIEEYKKKQGEKNYMDLNLLRLKLL